MENRHCEPERSEGEAIQGRYARLDRFVASLLAMTPTYRFQD